MDGLEKGEAARGAGTVTRPRAPLDRLGLCFTARRACTCVLYISVFVFTAGFSYGCVVRKKVVFLEDMKRDTQEFGESEVDSGFFWCHKETRECVDNWWK